MQEKIEKRWREYNKKLDEERIENIYDSLSNSIIRKTVSGEGVAAKNEIALLRKNWNLDGLNIIEIGAGYGAYCKTMFEVAKPASYTIIDTKSMLRFSRAYLKEEEIPCTFIDTEDPLPDGNWDLLISNVCISEIPEGHAKEMLSYLFKRVKKVAIIDVSIEWMFELLKDHFDTISKISCTECNQVNHYLYTGKNE